MSTRYQLDSYPTQFVLYYVNRSGDLRVHQADCSDICDLAYDEDNHIYFSSWLLADVPRPEIALLLTYEFSAVIAFNNAFYAFPAEIAENQPFRISAEDLARLRPNDASLGQIVYDTDLMASRINVGNRWMSLDQLYVGLDGRNAMTGPLRVGTVRSSSGLELDGPNFRPVSSGCYLGTSTAPFQTVFSHSVVQTAPSAISTWAAIESSVSFTADVPRTIPMSGFVQTVNPQNNFASSATTGRITYTGNSTRYFNVTVYFSLTSPTVLTATRLTHFIAKNGSLEIGKRITHSFGIAGSVPAGVYTDSISDIVQLAPNNSLQLGGQYTFTSPIVYENMAYSISQV